MFKVYVKESGLTPEGILLQGTPGPDPGKRGEVTGLFMIKSTILLCVTLWLLCGSLCNSF
jgi:hypothetical protein